MPQVTPRAPTPDIPIHGWQSKLSWQMHACVLSVCGVHFSSTVCVSNQPCNTSARRKCAHAHRSGVTSGRHRHYCHLPCTSRLHVDVHDGVRGVAAVSLLVLDVTLYLCKSGMACTPSTYPVTRLFRLISCRCRGWTLKNDPACASFSNVTKSRPASSKRCPSCSPPGLRVRLHMVPVACRQAQHRATMW